MDRTVTGVGGRLLAERLAAPSLNIREINDRLDAVSFLRTILKCGAFCARRSGTAWT